MTVEQFKSKVNGIVDDCVGIKMFFVCDDGKIRDSDVDDAALVRLKKSMTSKLRTGIVENESLSIPLLSDADERKNALYKFDFDDKPLEFDLLDKALQLRVNAPDKYQVGHGNFDDISAIIVVLTGRNNETLALYKHQYTVSVFKAEQGALNLFKSNNRLSELESNILKIDPNYVFLKLDTGYYVENVKTLESYFGFYNVIKDAATKCLAKLTDMGLIEDTAPLVDRVEGQDIAFTRKLAKISRNSPVIGAVANIDIISFAHKHKYLSKLLKLNDTGDKFVLKTKISQDHFVKLMTDDYLDSKLTHIQYDSLAKDKID